MTSNGPGAALGTSKQGYLLKNAKGKPMATYSCRRFFMSDGFQIQYFEDEGSERVRKGRFDLRNVSDLGPCGEPGVRRGLEMVLTEGPTAKPTKRITVSFDAEPHEADEWMQLWCSAVSYQYVANDLLKYRNPVLVERFNDMHYAQVCTPRHGRAWGGLGLHL